MGQSTVGVNNEVMQGFDIAQGASILKENERLGTGEIGLLASIGVSHVKVKHSCISEYDPFILLVSIGIFEVLLRIIVQVYRRPKIAVASTGDELVDPKEGSRLGNGKVRESKMQKITFVVLLQ